MDQVSPDVFKRVAVIGTSGAGKTSLARRLAASLGHPHIELDEIHWLPGWQPRPVEPFRAMVSEATAAATWVTDGNYSKVRDIVWGRATSVVWLNYPRPVVLVRILWRTWQRCIHQEELFSGNRETFTTAMFGRDSIIAWSMGTFNRHRREYPRLFQEPAYAHLHVVELRRPAQAKVFLAEIGQARDEAC
jgi:adenylate kinase family enzyme